MIPLFRRAGAAALAYRDFRFLFLGTVTMNAGMQMQVIVRGYFVYELTASPMLLGLVSTGFAIPLLVGALFGGEVADRLHRKRVIQFTQIIGFAVALSIGISISTETVTWVHLLVASFLTGIIYAFMVPSRTALVPSIVSDKHAGNAFALIAAAMSVTTLLAPAIAGNLYAWIGADGVYYTIAGLQLAAMGCIGLVGAREERTEGSRTPVFRQIGAGLAYIGSQPLIIVLIVTAMATALLSMPFRSLLPIYVVDLFDRGPETLGLLNSVMGTGAIIGAVVIAVRRPRRRGWVLLIGGFLSAAGLLVAAGYATLGVIAGCMVVIGVGDALRRSLALALIMESTAPEFRGRVSSVYTMNFGLMPLGTLPASALTELFGVRIATMALGVTLAGILLFVSVTQARVRRLE